MSDRGTAMSARIVMEGVSPHPPADEGFENENASQTSGGIFTAMVPKLLLDRSGGRGAGGGVEARDDGLGDLDGVGGVDQAGLELVEDQRQAHFLADGVDDGLDLDLQGLQLAVA